MFYLMGLDGLVGLEIEDLCALEVDGEFLFDLDLMIELGLELI